MRPPCSAWCKCWRGCRVFGIGPETRIYLAPGGNRHAERILMVGTDWCAIDCSARKPTSKLSSGLTVSCPRTAPPL